MKTKEEFLINQGEAWEYMNTLKVTPVADAYIAMEKYAKEECINFLNELRDYYFESEDSMIRDDRTSEEFYEIYKNHEK